MLKDLSLVLILSLLSQAAFPDFSVKKYWPDQDNDYKKIYKITRTRLRELEQNVRYVNSRENLALLNRLVTQSHRQIGLLLGVLEAALSSASGIDTNVEKSALNLLTFLNEKQIELQIYHQLCREEQCLLSLNEYADHLQRIKSDLCSNLGMDTSKECEMI